MNEIMTMIEHRLQEIKDGIIITNKITGNEYKVFYDLSSGEVMYTINTGLKKRTLNNISISQNSLVEHLGFQHDLIDSLLAVGI